MIKAGESVLLIFRFFIQQLGNLFSVLDSFEILPGISYFNFIIGIAIVCLFIKLLHFGINVNDTYDNEGNIIRNTTAKMRVGNYSSYSRHKSKKIVPKNKKS